MSHSFRPLTCAYWGERPLCLLENSSFGLQWSCSWTWTHPEYFCTVKLMVASEWSMSCLVSLILLHFYFHLAKASFSYILYFSQCRQRFFFSVLYQVVFLRNYILIVPVLEGRRWSFRRYEEGALFCQERSEENISGWELWTLSSDSTSSH